MFTVFYDKAHPEIAKFLIERLSKHGYDAVVDSEHRDNHPYLHKYYTVGSHLFFELDRQVELPYFSGELDFTPYTSDSAWAPDLAIVFSPLDSDSSEKLPIIENGVEAMLMWDKAPDEGFVELIPKTVRAECIDKAAKEEVNLPSEYSLRTEYFGDGKSVDMMLYEVIKPNTELPYTVVIYDYANNGDLKFFSSLFICHSWGVCRKDIEFLEQYWKFLGHTEKFDLDALLKHHTEECYPSADKPLAAEPVVYRRTLEDVKKTLLSKSVEPSRPKRKSCL